MRERNSTLNINMYLVQYCGALGTLLGNGTQFCVLLNRNLLIERDLTKQKEI